MPRLAATILLSILTLQSFALELKLNGVALPAARVDEAFAHRSRLALSDGTLATGVSLGELYPFMAEISRADAGTPAGPRALDASSLA